MFNQLNGVDVIFIDQQHAFEISPRFDTAEIYCQNTSSFLCRSVL